MRNFMAVIVLVSMTGTPAFTQQANDGPVVLTAEEDARRHKCGKTFTPDQNYLETSKTIDAPERKKRRFNRKRSKGCAAIPVVGLGLIAAIAVAGGSSDNTQ